MKLLATLGLLVLLPLSAGCPGEPPPPPPPVKKAKPKKKKKDRTGQVKVYDPAKGKRVWRSKAEAEVLIKANQERLAKMMAERDRVFEDADLESAKKSFESFRAEPSEANVDACFQVLRKHYVGEMRMAGQAEYFGRYADMILAELQANPGLKDTKLIMYLNFLTTDLEDTGHPALMEKGKQIAAAIGETEADMMKRELGGE